MLNFSRSLCPQGEKNSVLFEKQIQKTDQRSKRQVGSYCALTDLCTPRWAQKETKKDSVIYRKYCNWFQNIDRYLMQKQKIKKDH
jgi:hypothetical protein